MSNNCSTPASITNGYISVQLPYYDHGDTIYYVCKTGYYVVGNPLLTCDGFSGNWTGSVPSCATTNTDPVDDEWRWLAIVLAILTAAFVLLCLIVLLVKFCLSLCSRKARRTSDDQLPYSAEVGCCYACCSLCCLRCCCGRCFYANDVQPHNHVTYVRHSPGPPSVTGDSTRSVNGVRVSLVKKEQKVARELVNEWKPHANPVRNINTSTK